MSMFKFSHCLCTTLFKHAIQFGITPCSGATSYFSLFSESPRRRCGQDNTLLFSSFCEGVGEVIQRYFVLASTPVKFQVTLPMVPNTRTIFYFSYAYRKISCYPWSCNGRAVSTNFLVSLFITWNEVNWYDPSWLLSKGNDISMFKIFQAFISGSFYPSLRILFPPQCPNHLFLLLLHGRKLYFKARGSRLFQ